MHKSPADLAYDEMAAHYHGCASCSAVKDCPTGHALFMAWGALDTTETADDWWKRDRERGAIQRGEDVPDYGERSL